MLTSAWQPLTGCPVYCFIHRCCSAARVSRLQGLSEARSPARSHLDALLRCSLAAIRCCGCLHNDSNDRCSTAGQRRKHVRVNAFFYSYVHVLICDHSVDALNRHQTVTTDICHPRLFLQHSGSQQACSCTGITQSYFTLLIGVLW